MVGESGLHWDTFYILMHIISVSCSTYILLSLSETATFCESNMIYILQNYCMNKPLKFSIFPTGKTRPNAGHYGLHWDTAWGALDQATDLVLIILNRV